MSTTLKTDLHAYRYDIGDDWQRAEYERLLAELGDRKCHNVWAQPRNRAIPESGPVELETDFLFTDQWNSACGNRLFDWYEGIYPNKKIKQGYYLTITDEMSQIRMTVHMCGYCRTHYPDGGDFCTHCIETVDRGKHLKREDLHLLRLKPVSLTRNPREKLTPEEAAALEQKYQNLQDMKRAKVREQVIETRDRRIHEETTVSEGKLWLLDHGIDIDNVIYYGHTNKFCFGWRDLIKADEVQPLLDSIAGFPFEFEMKS